MSELGLVGLNLAFLLTGPALVFGLRGFETWRDVVRLAGLAYLLGAAATTTTLTFVLVLGGSVRVAVVLAVSMLLATVGGAAGIRLGRPLPHSVGAAPSPERFRWLGFACAALTAGISQTCFARLGSSRSSSGRSGTSGTRGQRRRRRSTSSVGSTSRSLRRSSCRVPDPRPDTRSSGVPLHG